jgi:hypothetical protein
LWRWWRDGIKIGYILEIELIGLIIQVEGYVELAVVLLLLKVTRRCWRNLWWWSYWRRASGYSRLIPSFVSHLAAKALQSIVQINALERLDVQSLHRLLGI